MAPDQVRRLPERSPSVISRELGDEFVVVDPITEQAHALEGPIALVWRAAGEGTWPALRDAEIEHAVAALAKLGLLMAPVGMTRRTMLGRTGTVLALSGVASIALPEVAALASVVRTVTATVTSCSVGGGNSGNTVGVSVSITGFAAGNVTVTLTYKDHNGTTVTTSIIVVANASGSGSSSTTLSQALPGPQTVTLSAQSQVQPAQTATGSFVDTC